MPSIVKPSAIHPSLQKNAIGLNLRDYEGTMSTLCAGCGHDSITAAIIKAFWESSVPPHRIAKLSGIGCSSKTPTYFVSGAHGFNSAHGRMPAIATGANAANRELTYIGVSGDGDSLSIGLGQMCHAIRRNLKMLYVIENNGVYGLTKGQFSASADVGSKAKKGDANMMTPLDPATLAMSIGATFVARSFSGDKDQLVPILRAGLAHRGLALVDVISPCVTFNDHNGSTKSYLYTRQHQMRATESELTDQHSEILAQISAAGETRVTMHDGSVMRFTQTPAGYDPTNRANVYQYLDEQRTKGVVPTGILYMDESQPDVHEMNNTPDQALATLPYGKLTPGSKALDELMAEFR
jgi:2-oxoglutarate/2-oxoacid ferredoxin oxidoreductase subunit beta